MAGEGRRFRESGYRNVKPLIPVNGKTFAKWSIQSVDFDLDTGIEPTFIFIVRTEHRDILTPHLLSIKPQCKVIYTDALTDGPAASALLAKSYIDNDTPLIVTNCDQIIKWDKARYLAHLETLEDRGAVGSIVTVTHDTPKYSYVQLDEDGYAVKVAEKELISNTALIGVHYWTKGSYFVQSIESAIQDEDTYNGEYYVSRTYNYLIKEGHRIVTYPLCQGEHYLSVGTPEELLWYMEHEGLSISRARLNDMKGGWFVGNFTPSVYWTSGFEVGYLTHKKGEKWPVHYHEQCTEINLLVRGRMILNGLELSAGDIFTFKPYSVSQPMEFIEDCEIVCVKTPSVPGDKIIC